MRIVDFADMLQGSINEKINECKCSIHKLHNPIYNQSLEVEIEALEWVKGQVQHLVRKDTYETKKGLLPTVVERFLKRAVPHWGKDFAAV